LSGHIGQIMAKGPPFEEFALENPGGFDAWPADGHGLSRQVDEEDTAHFAGDPLITPSFMVGDDLLQVDGVTDLNRGQSTASDEMNQFSESARGFSLTEEDVQPSPSLRRGFTRPRDVLRQKKDGMLTGSLQTHQTLDVARVRRALAGQSAGLHEEQSGLMIDDGHLELFEATRLPRLSLENAIPHIPEPNPETPEEDQVHAVCETGEGQTDFEIQVIEEEIVEGTSSSHHVDELPLVG